MFPPSFGGNNDKQYFYHGLLCSNWNPTHNRGAVITDELGQEVVLPVDFVLAMTGYQPDTSLLRNTGAEVDGATNKPALTESLESTVPGLYVMGTLIAGVESNVVFIENSRDHGAKIVADILRKRADVQSPVK